MHRVSRCYLQCASLPRHERDADGEPDPGKPLYSIANPNDTVDSILHSYEAGVMGSLHTILEKVQRRAALELKAAASKQAG
jgi:hypothetical protein